jgi:putative IMPACT (imprinted ancient) family translation regulator
VRAFSGALKAALEVLPRTERVERKTFLLEMSYPLYERVKLLVATHHGTVAGEEFGAKVLLTLVFAVDDVEPFTVALRELSAGSLEMLAAE